MIPVKNGVVPAQLDSWGTVANLGSTILEGECAASGAIVFGTPDAPISCGYFGVTRGVFRMVYPFNEHATVLQGQVTLTDESTGIATTYGVGDSWFVAKDTPVLWRVESDLFVKNYLAAV